MSKVKALINALNNKKISQDELRTQLDESLNELSKYSLKIEASGKHLLALINDMLDLSKIEAGMITAKGEEIDLYLVMTKLSQPFQFDANKKLSQPFQFDANKKGLSINIRANGYKIYADIDKFSKVLSILVDNAIHYSDSGLIDINCLQNNDMIEISVTDTGVK
jgi:signal transduction histidine kinase